MDYLLLILGLLLGAAMAYIVLHSRWDAERQTLRAELLATLEAKTRADRERLIRAYEQQLTALKTERREAIIEARRESTEQSRAVLKGKLAEQIAPLLPGFAYLPADARFLGDPVDYVVFSGYSEVKDNGANGDALEVVILDIKKGQAGLTKGQRRIAEAIAAGRVRFEVVRVFEDGTIKSHEWGNKSNADNASGQQI